MDETTISPGSVAPAAGPTVRRLVVLLSPTGQAVGRARVLERGSTLILGRADSQGLRLETEDRALSREHARIEVNGDGVRVVDLSRNGTRVNGRAVKEVGLRPGDVLRLGGHLLLYQELDLAEARALLGGASALDVARELLRGPSPSLSALRERLVKLAPARAPVLVLGETGVGKDVVARTLHALGGSSRPYVDVNCAAFSPELFEAELFGHVKGAFTNAVNARPGLIRAAQGGTLFLDEIGELAQPLQAKLLRAIETMEIRPVGAESVVRVDARIIAATNRDLAQEVERGNFRSDLYARLMTHVVWVPPLSARRDDILPLFMEFFAAEGRRDAHLEVDAAEALLCYGWPRNVREVRQFAVRLAVELEADGVIETRHLPSEVRTLQGPVEATEASLPPTATLEEFPSALLEIPRDRAPDEAEFRIAFAALGGNISRLAAFFRKDRTQIYRWCRRFQIETEAAGA